MSKPPIIHTEDIFNEYYNQFEDSNLHKRLSKKFTPKPYFKKFRSLKIIVLLSSYLFNIFSGLTASTLVFFFVLGLKDNWIISALVTFAFITLLELSKRRVNSINFKDVLQFKKLNVLLIMTAILLASMSICFSYFGSKRMVKQFSSAPELLEERRIKYHRRSDKGLRRANKRG